MPKSSAFIRKTGKSGMLLDLHIHSKYSVLDSKSDIVDIIAAARKAGLDGIAVTDHNEIKGALEALALAASALYSEGQMKRFIVIPGIEVSSIEGHIVCLGVRKRIERDLSAEETIAKVHDMSGIAIAAHPYDRFRDGVRDLCFKLPFDAIEINGHCLWGNSYASKMAREHGKPLVGGSDAHSVNGVGTVTTEVRADPTIEAVLGAIRAGQCKPVVRKNRLSHKASILTDKIARKCNKQSRL